MLEFSGGSFLNADSRAPPLDSLICWSGEEVRDLHDSDVFHQQTVLLITTTWYYVVTQQRVVSFGTTLRSSSCSALVSLLKIWNNKIYLDSCWKYERTCCVESSISEMQRLLSKWYLLFPTQQKGSEYSTLRILENGQFMRWMNHLPDSNLGWGTEKG